MAGSSAGSSGRPHPVPLRWVQRRAAHIQRTIAGFVYNREGPTYPVDKGAPLSALVQLGRRIQQERRPIQCVEGVLLALSLSQGFPYLHRFGISYKAKAADGSSHRHLTLGIYGGGRFGASGISREPGLHNKPVKFRTLRGLLRSYNAAWEEAGHAVWSITLGLPISHSLDAQTAVEWEGVKVYATDPVQVALWADAYQLALMVSERGLLDRRTLWEALARLSTRGKPAGWKVAKHRCRADTTDVPSPAAVPDPQHLLPATATTAAAAGGAGGSSKTPSALPQWSSTTSMWSEALDKRSAISIVANMDRAQPTKLDTAKWRTAVPPATVVPCAALSTTPCTPGHGEHPDLSATFAMHYEVLGPLKPRELAVVRWMAGAATLLGPRAARALLHRPPRKPAA